MKRTQYTAEFKTEAVKQILEKDILPPRSQVV
jgi:hypothetical protein